MGIFKGTENDFCCEAPSEGPATMVQDCVEILEILVKLSLKQA